MSKEPEGITLADWATKVGRSEKYVRNFWRPLREFSAKLGWPERTIWVESRGA